ncbi:MAG: selenoneine synthase SenA [Anaeromyxobacteraceae bacterium]
MDPSLRAELAAALLDARARTLAFVEDLPAAARLGPRLAIVNPPLWEVGHVAWFAERWLLRHGAGRAPLRADGDALYDSAAVPHDARWDLPLPSWGETLAFLRAQLDAAVGLLDRGEADASLARLTLLHEDMHGEAFAYTRQTLGHAAPRLGVEPAAGGPWPGDAQVPGGSFTLGAPDAEPFAFDNERPPRAVEVAPFAIARAAVTQAELAGFAGDGGYARRELWSDAGWRWRVAAGADAPYAWRSDGAGWQRRAFDRWVRLEPHRPALHVSWYEADAYCRWARRRLPSEAEWEVAAAAEPDGQGGLAATRRRYPWGDAPPSAARANLDLWSCGAADVAAHAAGDSAFGCRQLLGNAWEWTASDFLPYPGFAPGLYREYSEPWFGTHKVLRGGSFATRARLVTNAYRNFYTPDRRDVWAGFRTCALTP